MNNPPFLRSYLTNAFRWRRGRQHSGYDKMLMLTGMWPFPFDVYLLRFPVGSQIAPHKDKVSAGRHYRFNILLRRALEGGEFKCKAPLFETGRIKFFRPDISEHSVSRVSRGSRFVLSIGWVRKD